ncbi:MAG: alpha,2-mannosyltransferase [Chloroflexota bacterium]|nr:alpha,2-mannosyltransferase [Chloroflexota bacterium]
MLPSGGVNSISSAYGLRLLAKPRVRLAIVVFVALIVVVYRAYQLAYLTTQPQWGYDLSFYWTAAQHLIHGEPIYSLAQLSGPYAPQGQDGFLYPPPFAALMIPLAAVTPDARSAEWIWSAFGIAIVLITLAALLRSERLGQRFSMLRGRGGWLLLAAAFAFPPVIGELSIGNVHLVLLGLFTLAWLGIRRGDLAGDAMAGIGLGAAALIKVFPGVLLVWLLATRRYRAAVAMVVAAAALVIVTLPFTGIEPWLQYPRVLGNLSAVYDTTDTISPAIWLAPYLGFTTARWLVLGIGVVIVVWSARSSGRDAVPAISFATAVVVSVLIAPNVFHHYLAIFVLPLILGLAAGVRLRWLALAYLLMSGGQQPAIGEFAWIVNRVLPTAGALVLLGALALTRRPAEDISPAGTLRGDAVAHR